MSLVKAARERWAALGERQTFIVVWALILLAAMLLRIAAVVVTRHSFHLANDGLDFWQISHSLAAGHGFGRTQPYLLTTGATAFRTPLYSLVLAALGKVFGFHVTAFRIFSAAEGTVAVALIGVVATQVWGRATGQLAACVAAVYPPLILSSTGVQYEPLLIVLMLGALATALEARRSGRWVWMVVTGVLVGLATLTREYGLVVGLPAIWIAVSGRGLRRSLLAGVGVIALALLVVSPWTIRNAATFDAFEPVSTSSGFALAGTYNRVSDHDASRPADWRNPYLDPTILRTVKRRRPLNEAQLDRLLRSEAKQYAEDHPSYLGKVAFWNTVRLFDLKGWGPASFIASYVPYSQKLVKLSVLSYYVAMVLLLVGLTNRRWRRPGWAFWLIPVLGVLGVVFVSGNFRYRQPIEPFIVFLAALGLERLWTLVVRRRRSRAPAAVTAGDATRSPDRQDLPV